MPRGSTSSNTKRSSNNQNSSGNSQNGGLAPPKRQQARSRASSNANIHVPGNQSNGSASSTGQSHGSASLEDSVNNNNSNNNGKQSTLQESSSSKGQLGVNGVGMAANNSSGDSSTSTMARLHLDGDGGMNGTVTPQKRMIDLDQSGASVSGGDSHYKTILPSWPLIDSLMLLIILLQLPTTLLTLVHLLFASLSFVPHNLTLLGPNPSSPTINYGAISNYIFQGQQGGPSVLTIIISDIIMALVSMLLWPSARIFLVDLAQAVVALSLGAGSTGTGNSGAMRNAAVCASVVGISQILRERSQIAHHLGIPVSQNAGNELNTLTPSSTSAGSIRSALAVHIVAQGIMKATRRWLTLRDPAEYAASHPTTSSSSSISASSNPSSSSSSSATSTAKGGSASGVVSNAPKDPEVGCPTTSTATTTTTTVKKKGRLGIWVRGQQPLWAALASSIVHLKEVEKLHAANASDSKVTSSDTTYGFDEPKVWITRIGSNEIEFGSNYHPPNIVNDEEGVDKRFPFIVELNGIKWPQTTISMASGGRGEDSTISRTRDEEEWTAEISGLTPTTVYDISFIRRTTGEIIYSASVGTTSKQGEISNKQFPEGISSNRRIAAANVDAPKEPVPAKPQRPLSPITTLQNSLNASRSNLEEQKRRIKVSKKGNSRRISGLRSEIDSLKSRLGSGDKGDERARRRALSLRDSVRRAEEETENIQMELQTLKELPEDQEKEWEEKKKSWKSEKENLTVSEKDAVSMREQADRRLLEIKNEINSATAKREKAARRVSNLRADLERAKTETAATAEEREKAKQREQLKQRRQGIELEFSASIAKMEQGMISFRHKSRENYASIRSLEASFLMQQQQQQQQQQAAHVQQMAMGGLTATDLAFPLAAQLIQNMSPRAGFGQPVYNNNPYGAFYGNPSPHTSGSFSSINLQPQNPIVSPFPSAYPGYDRGRSTSIFSMDSALTNLSDYDNNAHARKKSIPEGVSSGSSSGSDSHEVDGYINHIATSGAVGPFDNQAVGYFGVPAELNKSFAEKLKSGVAFPPLPPPSTANATAVVKPEAIAQ
ncbi:hypothetical protein TWF506_000958 [Arthrobotrys conoides]|uniref:Ubiquitination network signaling protein n=1 Tax=Arthrobotrys conoides TaxID=74498 RepID=A0AAN8S4R1_9PEZI